MRIARIEAIAYGAIAGRVIEPGSGLTVVHGPNESGKSSTMDLIRGVLFGFPALRRDGSAPLREPRGGGARSGRIDLVDADGRRIVVERTHGAAVRVTGADGDPVGDAALSRALGIADRALFDQVQSFDSADLARIDLLDDPSVRAGVLASAVLGAGGGAGPVLKDLRERGDALYLKSGENQPYAHALRRVKDARRVLREAEAEAAALADAEDGLAGAAERVARGEADLAEAGAQAQVDEPDRPLRELREGDAVAVPADDLRAGAGALPVRHPDLGPGAARGHADLLGGAAQDAR
ncbi:MAG: AAA family ATPase, partial [Actinomycetota bacterium]